MQKEQRRGLPQGGAQRPAAHSSRECPDVPLCAWNDRLRPSKPPMLLSVARGNGPFAVRMSASKEAQTMLNENIKRARKAKGLSQEELAAKPTATGRFWRKNHEKQVLDRLRSGALLGMGVPLIFTYSACTAGSAPPGPRPPSGTEPGLRPGPRPQWRPGARPPQRTDPARSLPGPHS